MLQITAWERRDDIDRETLSKLALELCKIIKSNEGITSSKYFFMQGGNGVVFVTEGTRAALSAQGGGNPDYVKYGWELADHTRNLLDWLLEDPRDWKGR